MAALSDLNAMLKSISKQLKYAQARALTKVARQIEASERRNIENTFNNPTPFTVNSVRSLGARRDNLQAKVFIQSIATGYLEPYELGGVRKLNSNTLLNPKNVGLNRYGNLARDKITSLTAKPNVFVGAVKTARGEVRGIWQRKARRKTTSKKRNAVPKEKRGQLKLLIRFGDALLALVCNFYAGEPIMRAISADYQVELTKLARAKQVIGRNTARLEMGAKERLAELLMRDQAVEIA